MAATQIRARAFQVQLRTQDAAAPPTEREREQPDSTAGPPQRLTCARAEPSERTNCAAFKLAPADERARRKQASEQRAANEKRAHTHTSPKSCATTQPTTATTTTTAAAAATAAATAKTTARRQRQSKRTNRLLLDASASLARASCQISIFACATITQVAAVREAPPATTICESRPSPYFQTH